MAKPQSQIVVLRHPESREVVSVAQWTLLVENHEEGEKHKAKEEASERQEVEEGAYRE